MIVSMAVKNFVFRENWVGSKVAGVKTTFFAIFEPNLDPRFGSKKAQIRNSLYTILVKKDRN